MESFLSADFSTTCSMSDGTSTADFVSVSHLRTIGKFVCGKVYLAERTFSYQAAEGIVTNGLEVLVCKLAADLSESDKIVAVHDRTHTLAIADRIGRAC